MLTVYIVISILWGILIFLNTFKEYKWYSTVIFSIVGILFWPGFILAAIIVEIIRLCKNEKYDVDSATSDEMKQESPQIAEIAQQYVTLADTGENFK